MCFDVDWLILSGLFLGQPVICDPFCDMRASYVSFPGYSTAPLSEKETENNPLSSLAVPPSSKTAVARGTADLKRFLFLHSASSSAPRALAAALPQPFPVRSRRRTLPLPAVAAASVAAPFLWYIPLVLGLDRPLVLFCYSRSCCCCFCFCNFSVGSRYYLDFGVDTRV